MNQDRAGRVGASDDRFFLHEECPTNMWEARKRWEAVFAKEVYSIAVRTLKGLGWTLAPQHYIRVDGMSKFCRKGDLKADLSFRGGSIELEFFQSVNCPTRPDNEGRYESDKLSLMPYLMRLEVKRTQRALVAAIVAAYPRYEVVPAKPSIGPGQLTAREWIEVRIRESWHYLPELGHAEIRGSNAVSADGGTITHGAKVYAVGWGGAVIHGTAYYNINNMWWVAHGRYGVSNLGNSSIYLNNPGDLRRRCCPMLARKRLESALSKAVAVMDFTRAAILKNVLFPEKQPIFLIKHRESGMWYRSGFSGYTRDAISAGKYTHSELERAGIVGDKDLRIVPQEEVV